MGQHPKFLDCYMHENDDSFKPVIRDFDYAVDPNLIPLPAAPPVPVPVPVPVPKPAPKGRVLRQSNVAEYFQR